MKNFLAAIAALIGLVSACAMSPVTPPQDPVPGFNFDEALVPDYVLPEVLLCSDGTKVENHRQWEQKRRPELLQLFENEMYGTAPAAPALRFETREAAGSAYGGKATRKQVRIHYAKGQFIDLLLYIPTGAKQPPPVFLGLNFAGNHAINEDSLVFLPDTKRLRPDFEVEERGVKAHRWDIERILDNGFALATFCLEDVAPDSPFPGGALAVWPQYTWKCVAAWAWGLSRAMDYLEQEPAIDSKRVAVMGHSRLGKAALWAGAKDTRFAMVVSNESGCSGAALARRRFGETLGYLNRVRYYWFAYRFQYYNDYEEGLPFDQHELLALIAPRPLYVASASEDVWSDPLGEFLSLAAASPAYELYGYSGFRSFERPRINKPMRRGKCGYHIRDGKHAVKPYDWEQFLSFAAQKI